MKNKIEAVKAFHTAFKLGHSETLKANLGVEKNRLRFNLMKEENEEYLEAANNNDFKKTYELQQELLADWMVSQRAFKELAIGLGLSIGRTKEDVIAEGMANEVQVLNNQTKHGNNAEDNTFINKYSERLKEKMKKT